MSGPPPGNAQGASSEAHTGGDGPQLQKGASSSSVSSKTSLASKLTSLVKKPNMGFGMSFKPSLAKSNTSQSVAQMVDFALGDQCETISLVTVRKEESTESAVVSELPIGSLLEIRALGTGRRIKIGTTSPGSPSVEGWISSKTKMNEPLVMKRGGRQPSGGGSEFDVGGVYQVISMVTVRAGESLESENVAEMHPGVTVQILQVGTTNSRRSEVRSDQVTGWISTITRQGEHLLAKIEETGGQAGEPIGASSSQIKVTLEAARSGDLAQLRKAVESTSRLNLNASDIRGKTTLIYAAAFGNRDIVEYLLARGRGDVDVNQVDDTQKSALHHASKRARTRRDSVVSHDCVQAELVDMLLQAGSHMEARDHNGCTALMFAVANGDTAVAKSLLDAQANVNVKDFEGHMPLDYAINFKHEPMIQLLTSAGAQSNAEPHESSESEREEAVPAASSREKLSLEVPAEGAGEKKGEKKGAKSSASPAASPAASPRGPTASGAAPKKAAGKKKGAPKEGMDSKDSKQDAKGGDKKKKAAGGEKGAKGSAKKKAAKRMSVKKVISSAMLLEALDDTGADAAKEVHVQEIAKEEEDEKTRALRKLAVVQKETTAYKELEAAIQQAQAAGALEADVQSAKEKVKVLKVRHRVREMLVTSMGDKDVKALREAIVKAEEAGLPQGDIDEAQAVLMAEQPKQMSRDRLAAAKKSGNIKELKAAIEDGKQVGLEKAEMRDVEDLLAGAESKGNAEKALREAVTSRKVGALRIAIQQGQEAGVDRALIEPAEAALKEELPKQEARDTLEAAIEANEMDAIQAALKKAQAAGLDATELEDAQEAVRRLELLAQVQKTMQESLGANLTDIDSVREAKLHLAEAIAKALEAGVPEAELHDAELRRKKLHNTVEDLKGSIRVFCRIRPLSSKEKTQGDTEVTKQLNPMSLQVGKEGGKSTEFQFDAVWTPGTQDEIFEDCKDLVQSAVDGYNVTLFAYGQTGAGKTFTMAGVPGMLGVAPRTTTEIFKVIDQNKDRFQFTVMASMLELYRQDLVDLLVKGNPAQAKQKLNIRIEKAGTVTVEHLTSEECRSAKDLDKVLDRGNKARTVASTAMNSESSRSHLVLIVHIISVNRETGDQLRGKILIVDLAGSERLKKSQTAEAAQKESIEINKSLTALGDVIEALTKGSKVIPYRNHKLTQLMQDAIGGTSKTLMFVNCSPAASNEAETLMSLKYAVRAKNITNTAAKA